jgi:capsular polysaccharide biosynthesis protein
MSKPQFTFKNYLKEIKKCWIFVIVVVILGAAGGAYYSFSKPTQYTASTKVSVYNPAVNNGPVSSPYAQIAELLMSSELVEGELENYEVIEKPFGVFEITATSTDSQKAIDTANTVMNSTDKVISFAFEDAENYDTTILVRATEATPTNSTKKRLISTAIVVAGAFIFALIAVFVKFDYIAEK